MTLIPILSIYLKSTYNIGSVTNARIAKIMTSGSY